MTIPAPAVDSFIQRWAASGAAIFFGFVLPTVGAAFGDDNWPQFRGPTGQGFTTERNLPQTWGGPQGENVLWKSPLIGEGHASPIVWGDRIFVCTARWPADVSQRDKVIPEHHVLCYAASDGRRVWDVRIPPGPWLRTDFRSGPGGGYAAPTPTTDGKLIYCVFGSSVIAALDFDGRIVWRKEIVPYTFDVTIGSSPILYQDTVLMFCPAAERKDSRLVAYDKTDGRVKWSVMFPTMGFGHSTPLLIDVKGKSQLLVLASGMAASPDALQSVDPGSGKRLWWCRGQGDASSPAFGAGIVFFDSGRGGSSIAVDPSGEGDVSATHIRWKTDLPEALGSPVILDHYVYRLHVPGILKCFEAAGGRKAYVERLEGISSTWASPIVDGKGRIFFATAGKSYVVQSGPVFKVLAVNDLGDGNHPSPAVAAGRMFLVGMKNVYCIGKR
jgi:outer membrane protein assembly factor BamB